MPRIVAVGRALPLVLCLALAGCSKLEDPSLFPAFDPEAVTEPAPKTASAFNRQRNLYFGDLHIHTSLSTDALAMGVRARPEHAYRFAMGHAIEHAAGYPISISRPLDFAAVTDHAEYLGQAREAAIDLPAVRESLRDILLDGNALSIAWAWLETMMVFTDAGFGLGSEAVDPAVNRAAWQQVIDAAEQYNQPGVFTTFVGYEWSASVGDLGTHIHRNVIYRSSEVSALPFSSIDSMRPQDLWAFLEREERQGRVAMAIPHNANLSKGNMYARQDSDGRPIDKAYADARAYYEPLGEILQIKGASETHPLLSSRDEFAGHEIAWIEPDLEASLDTVQGSYARDALRTGLELFFREGFNPYRFGVIGSSDSHNASSPVEESDYSGKLPMMDGSAGLRTGEAALLRLSRNPVASWSSGGLAGVWAPENTRGAIFDALRRKETFATSGSRLSLRMFAGWDLSPAMLSEADFLDRAYAIGVPMGGRLHGSERQTAPAFLVRAYRDPAGANLDRLQIVKGWVDGEGRSHEKVFNIAASAGRVIDPVTGKLPPVGNTVSLSDASYRNTIGAESLGAFWQDPEFHPRQAAFYYARVLEIPTPRWSTYDAVRLGTEPMQPATIQERAIGSAIWYSPKLK